MIIYNNILINTLVVQGLVEVIFKDPIIDLLLGLYKPIVIINYFKQSFTYVSA